MNSISFEELQELISNPANEEILSRIHDFETNPSSFPICQSYLERNPNDVYQLFLSSTLLKLTQQFCITWELNYALQIANWCLQVLDTHSFNPPTIRSLSSTFGVIIVTFWKSDETKAVFNLTSQFLKNPDLNHQALGLNLLIYTIQMFSSAPSEFSTNFNTFGNKFLPTCYNISKDFLLTNSAFLDLSLQLSLSCLSYNQKENEIAHLPQMRQFISDPTNLNLYFNIYTKTEHKMSLKCIQCFVMTSNSSFERGVPPCKDLVYEQFITDSIIFFQNQKEIELKSNILLQFSKRLTHNEINKYQFFIPFIKECFNWTISLFSNAQMLYENKETLQNLINFWGCISFSMMKSGDTEVKVFLYENYETLTKSYIELLLQIIRNIDLEDVFIFLDDLDLSPVKGLIQIVPSLISMIMSLFNETNDQIELSLYLNFISMLLILEPSSSIDDTISEYWEPLFNDAIRIIRLTKNFIEQKIENFSLEISVLKFISTFRLTHFSSNFEMSNELFERNLISVITFYDKPLIIQYAIKNLHKVFPSNETLMDLILNHSEERFLFMGLNKKAREEFIGFLFMASYKFYHTEKFLSTFSENCNLYIFIKDLESICKYGICETKDFLIFSEYLIPNILNFIYQNLDPNIIYATIKMLFSFLNRKNISFEENSPNGIILFKEISKFVFQSFKSYNESIDFEYKIKLIRRISDLLSKLLDNDYVMFKVFQIYEDPILLNLIQQLYTVLSTLQFNVLSQYPNPTLSIISLFNSLTKRHLNEMGHEFMMFMMNFICFFINNEFYLNNVFSVLINFCDFLIISRNNKILSELEPKFSRISLFLWQNIIKKPKLILTDGGKTLAVIALLYPQNFVQIYQRIEEVCECKFDLNLDQMFELLLQKKNNDFYCFLEDVCKKIHENNCFAQIFS